MDSRLKLIALDPDPGEGWLAVGSFIFSFLLVDRHRRYPNLNVGVVKGRIPDNANINEVQPVPSVGKSDVLVANRSRPCHNIGHPIERNVRSRDDVGIDNEL